FWRADQRGDLDWRHAKGCRDEVEVVAQLGRRSGRGHASERTSIGTEPEVVRCVRAESRTIEDSLEDGRDVGDAAVLVISPIRATTEPDPPCQDGSGREIEPASKPLHRRKLDKIESEDFEGYIDRAHAPPQSAPEARKAMDSVEMLRSEFERDAAQLALARR